MKIGVVYFRDSVAGVLARFSSGNYEFRYLKQYISVDSNPSVSATLPKSQTVHVSPHMFSFFFGLLSEGIQKERQCRLLKIDERDYFSRLLETSRHGAAGAVRVERRIRRR